MKQINVYIVITDPKKLETQQIRLEKSADHEEIDVLASGISTLFLKSK